MEHRDRYYCPCWSDRDGSKTFDAGEQHNHRSGGIQEMSGKRVDKPERKRATTSKVIAIGVLIMDAVATLAVLALCGLAIVRRFDGALPYLTTLIGALQAVTGVVLGAYFNKSKAENTKGGIVYDTALGVSDSDTDL